jgi:hypothetical protein
MIDLSAARKLVRLLGAAVSFGTRLGFVARSPSRTICSMTYARQL